MSVGVRIRLVKGARVPSATGSPGPPSERLQVRPARVTVGVFAPFDTGHGGPRGPQACQG